MLCMYVCSKGESITLKGHMGAVRSVEFSRDGRLLLTGSDDKTAKVPPSPYYYYYYYYYYYIINITNLISLPPLTFPSVSYAAMEPSLKEVRM